MRNQLDSGIVTDRNILNGMYPRFQQLIQQLGDLKSELGDRLRHIDVMDSSDNRRDFIGAVLIRVSLSHRNIRDSWRDAFQERDLHSFNMQEALSDTFRDTKDPKICLVRILLGHGGGEAGGIIYRTFWFRSSHYNMNDDLFRKHLILLGIDEKHFTIIFKIKHILKDQDVDIKFYSNNTAVEVSWSHLV